MYPLGMTRPLAVAVTVAALAAPSAAHAASLTTQPAKQCYRAGETVHFIGDGFTPSNQVNLVRDDVLVSQFPADQNGRFDVSLRLLMAQGSQRRTYTATDSVNQGLSASVAFTVSALRVDLAPRNGPASRRFRVRAQGFTTGRTLWAHVIHKRSKRLIKIGRLKGSCHTIRTRRRLLTRNARLGTHRIQFDTYRRYRADRQVQKHFTIRIVRGDR
jgi:hypothetical protein